MQLDKPHICWMNCKMIIKIDCFGKTESQSFNLLIQSVTKPWYRRDLKATEASSGLESDVDATADTASCKTEGKTVKLRRKPSRRRSRKSKNIRDVTDNPAGS